VLPVLYNVFPAKSSPAFTAVYTATPEFMSGAIDEDNDSDTTYDITEAVISAYSFIDPELVLKYTDDVSSAYVLID